MNENDKPAWLIEEEDEAQEMPDLLDIIQLARLFRMSVPTLRRQLREGPPKRSSLDPRMVPDQYIGGKRFFLKSAAENLLLSK